jgi:hypothetical protein
VSQRQAADLEKVTISLSFTIWACVALIFRASKRVVALNQTLPQYLPVSMPITGEPQEKRSLMATLAHVEDPTAAGQ